MSFYKYKDGAWMEPETGLMRYDTSTAAWVEAEAAYRYDTSTVAWTEAWSGIKYMYELSANINNAWAEQVTSNDWDYPGWTLYSDCAPGVADEAVYYTEGNFTNPVVHIDYQGVYEYENSSGEIKYSNGSGLWLYTRTTDGTEAYTGINTSLGTTSGWEEGSYDATVSGTFDRIGVKLYLNARSSSADYCMRSVDIWNTTLNGKPWLVHESCTRN